jgi:hypothetical protein
MNAHSSRSHVIVSLHIESRRVPMKSLTPLRTSWGPKDRPQCISTLNLVDLAGSERANKAGTSGETLKEGSFINKSLLTLGTVIANLSEGKLQHIPYRNSKLTRLLATALGGNAKTCMITCISPASGNLAESLNTLRFATRAKRVVNHVMKNEILDMKSLTAKLAQQANELDYLKSQLEICRSMGFNLEDLNEQEESLRELLLLYYRRFSLIQFICLFGGKLLTLLLTVKLPQQNNNNNNNNNISNNNNAKIIQNLFDNIKDAFLFLMGKIFECYVPIENNKIKFIEGKSKFRCLTFYLSDKEVEFECDKYWNELTGYQKNSICISNHNFNYEKYC